MDVITEDLNTWENTPHPQSDHLPLITAKLHKMLYRFRQFLSKLLCQNWKADSKTYTELKGTQNSPNNPAIGEWVGLMMYTMKILSKQL